MAPAPTHARLLGTAARTPRPGQGAAASIARAMRAVGISRATRQPLDDILAADAFADQVSKAAVGILGTSDVGDLMRETLAGLLVEIAPASAAASIIGASLRFDADRGEVRVPHITATADATWTAEHEPIAVSAMAFDDAAMIAKKLGTIVAVSRETLQLSTSAAALEDLLRQAVAKALDLRMFSTDAATELAPAGLLHGVTAISAFPGGDAQAALTDIRAMVSATAAAGPGATIVAHPSRLVALAHHMPSLQVLTAASAHVAEDFIAAIVPRAVATIASGVDVDAMGGGTVHMSSTPAHISDPGEPQDVAAPVRSLWQTDSIGLRTIVSTNWTRRSPHAVAWITGATW